MKVKVIIRDGITEAVLRDGEEPLEIEIVDCCKDYADTEELDKYAEELYNDPSLRSESFTTANFEEEE